MKLFELFSTLNEAIELTSEQLLAYAIVVAETYDAAPVTNDEGKRSYDALIQSTERLFRQARKMIDIRSTENDPYHGEVDVAKDIAHNKQLKVFSGGQQHPVMNQDQNTQFRAVHDFYTHVAKNLKNVGKVVNSFTTTGFTLRGEINAFLVHSKIAPPDAIPVLFTEVVGQASYYFVMHNFPVQKAVVLNGFDYRRIGKMDSGKQLRFQEILRELTNDQTFIMTKIGGGHKLMKQSIDWELLSTSTKVKHSKLNAEVGGELTEAPIEDYGTVGNFEKSSSFRDKRDRYLVTGETPVARMKMLFANTDHPLALYFVNTPEANKFTEVGRVTLDWLEEQMPTTFAALMQETQAGKIKFPMQDVVTFIFTNNKGAERVIMTPWIIAHRMGHAFNAPTPLRKVGEHSYYRDVENVLINYSSAILSRYYDINDIPTNRDELIGGWKQNVYKRTRINQLILRAFWRQIGAFRSARENNLRDWFEMTNELLAQYLTTGTIKFNPAPKQFTVSFGGFKKRTFYIKDSDIEMINNDLVSLSYEIFNGFDALLGSSVGDFFVM